MSQTSLEHKHLRASYDAPAPQLRKLANPGPLGLFSFASTTLILSLINVQTRGVAEPHIVLGMAMACGGLAQLLAGMWEFACGNTFGATAFTSYGAFWISYALIFIPGTGILAAYEKAPADLENAVAFFLTAWFVFTFIMWLGTFRTNMCLVALFFSLDMTFMFLMIGAYKGSVRCHKIGGGLGLLTAAIAYYTGAAGVLTPDVTFIQLPVGDLPKFGDV